MGQRECVPNGTTLRRRSGFSRFIPALQRLKSLLLNTPLKVVSFSASPPFGSAQGFELAETAPHETGEAFQTFVRREDTPALP